MKKVITHMRSHFLTMQINILMVSSETACGFMVKVLQKLLYL